jgi:hypothetical protein
MFSSVDKRILSEHIQKCVSVRRGEGREISLSKTHPAENTILAPVLAKQLQLCIFFKFSVKNSWFSWNSRYKH